MIDIKKEKHNESARKYLEKNREKHRKASLDYIHKRKAKNPDVYKKLIDERAKKYRLKKLAQYQEKEREASQRRRELLGKKEYNRQQREYRKNNPELFKKYTERYKERNKVHSRNILLRKYGLTQDSYEAMLFAQKGKCAICKTSFGTEVTNIDHCHETGNTRSLLCSPCNIVLGYIEKISKKNQNILSEFVEYLKTHAEVQGEALRD